MPALQGKTVLLTEMNCSLAQETALAFAREGADLFLCSSQESAVIEQVAHKASAMGVKVMSATCDVSDETQVKDLIEKGISNFGCVDILVNHAESLMPESSLAEIPFDQWKQAMKMRLTGTFLICKTILPVILKSGWGRIINYIGLAGFFGADVGTGTPLIATATSELGIVAFTRGVAREYGTLNITANCIGYVGATAIEDLLPHSAPNLADPVVQEASSLAVYLSTEAAALITGQCYLISGGKYFL